MKNITAFIVLSILIISCKKSTNTTIEEVPSDITVTTYLYTAKSLSCNGCNSFWVNVKTTYQIGSPTTLYASFNNPYWSGNNKVTVAIKMPVFSKDTSIETNQPYTGAAAFNYKVDSIKGATNFKLIW